jgi:hypothetical protein
MLYVIAAVIGALWLVARSDENLTTGQTVIRLIAGAVIGIIVVALFTGLS